MTTNPILPKKLHGRHPFSARMVQPLAQQHSEEDK